MSNYICRFENVKKRACPLLQPIRYSLGGRSIYGKNYGSETETYGSHSRGAIWRRQGTGSLRLCKRTGTKRIYCADF